MSRRQLVRLRSHAGAWCAILLLGLSAGCASVDPQPFADFSGSVRQVRTGADAALQYNAEESRKTLIQRIVNSAESDSGALTALRLDVDPTDPLRLDPNKIPGFLEARWFRDGVFALNTAIVEYAGLLHQLAQPELIPEEKFDQMAKELNGNVNAALKALKQDVEPQHVALFSAATAGLTRAFLEHRRGRHLSNAIEGNQPAVEVIARHGRDAIQTADVDLAENYRDSSQAILRTLVASPKKTVAKKLVRLDEELVARLDMLRTLDRAYASLPRAHRELQSAVKNPSISLESIRGLYEEGRRLQNLNAELSAAGANRQ
jgi:hypothetical protein